MMLIADAITITRNERILQLFNYFVNKYAGYYMKLNEANSDISENYKKKISEYYYKLNKYEEYLERIIPMMNDDIIIQMDAYVCNSLKIWINETLPLNIGQKILLISQKTNEMILRANPEYKMRLIYIDEFMLNKY